MEPVWKPRHREPRPLVQSHTACRQQSRDPSPGGPLRVCALSPRATTRRHCRGAVGAAGPGSKGRCQGPTASGQTTLPPPSLTLPALKQEPRALGLQGCSPSLRFLGGSKQALPTEAEPVRAAPPFSWYRLCPWASCGQRDGEFAGLVCVQGTLVMGSVFGCREGCWMEAGERGPSLQTREGGGEDLGCPPGTGTVERHLHPEDGVWGGH